MKPMAYRLRSLVHALALGAVLAGSVGPARGASAPAKVRMIIGLSGSLESVEGQAVLKFKSLVEPASHGNVGVQIFPSGQLGTFGDLATGLKVGNNHAMFIQPDALGQQINLATVNSWPFMFDAQEQMLKAWKGPAGRELAAAIEKLGGYRMLAPTWNLPRNVLTNRKVAKMAELAGTKVRVPGTPVYVQQMKALGLSPTPMSINEVYSGMQQGVVQGMEATLSDANAQSLADVTKTIVTTRHVLSPKMWLFWGKWVDGLAPADRDAVVKSVEAASEWYSASLQAEERVLIQKFTEKGAVFVEPDWSRDEMRRKVAGMRQALPELAAWADKLAAAGR